MVFAKANRRSLTQGQDQPCQVIQLHPRQQSSLINLTLVVKHSLLRSFSLRERGRGSDSGGLGWWAGVRYTKHHCPHPPPEPRLTYERHRPPPPNYRHRR
jgi:hypothetical protein